MSASSGTVTATYPQAAHRLNNLVIPDTEGRRGQEHATGHKLCINPIFCVWGLFLFCLICEIHAATFQTFFVKESSNLAGANNVLTFRIVVSQNVESSDVLIFKGLKGTQTQDTNTLSLGGSNTATFGTSGTWKQDSGELEIELQQLMSPQTVYAFRLR